MDAAAELKRWNNDWQACSATARALETLATPVLDAAKEADQARKSAKAAFQAAGKLASGRRDWPPTRQSLADEVKIFQGLEKPPGWAALAPHRLRRAGARARDRSTTSSICSKTASPPPRAWLKASRRKPPELEREVEALQQRWQAVEQRYPGQADLDLEIKDLVSQADQRLAQLKTQYKRGGLDYDQVLSGLREQVTLLRGARFNTADGQPVTLT